MEAKVSRITCRTNVPWWYLWMILWDWIKGLDLFLVSLFGVAFKFSRVKDMSVTHRNKTKYAPTMPSIITCHCHFCRDTQKIQHLSIQIWSLYWWKPLKNLQMFIDLGPRPLSTYYRVFSTAASEDVGKTSIAQVMQQLPDTSRGH